jgi:hypothetical protein
MQQPERTWGEWFQSFTGTSQTQPAPASGTIAYDTPVGEGGVGGRKKRRVKTRRSTKKSRKSRLHRK